MKKSLANIGSDDPHMQLPLDFRFPRSWPETFIDRLQFWVIPNFRKWLEGGTYAEVEAYAQVFPSRGGTCCSQPFSLPFQYELKDVRAFFMVQIQPDGDWRASLTSARPRSLNVNSKRSSNWQRRAHEHGNMADTMYQRLAPVSRHTVLGGIRVPMD